MKLSPKGRALAKMFATGRITISEMNGPPEDGFPPRFFPKIAGRYVAPTSMPNQGYRDRRDARHDAAQFKRECRKALRPDPYA